VITGVGSSVAAVLSGGGVVALPVTVTVALVKPDILAELTSSNSPYKDLMKKMGNNPDIYLSSDGQIQIVSTQFKGKSFITDLNIADFLP